MNLNSVKTNIGLSLAELIQAEFNISSERPFQEGSLGYTIHFILYNLKFGPIRQGVSKKVYSWKKSANSKKNFSSLND